MRAPLSQEEMPVELKEAMLKKWQAEDKIKALDSAGITVARNLGALGETALEVMGQA